MAKKKTNGNQKPNKAEMKPDKQSSMTSKKGTKKKTTGLISGTTMIFIVLSLMVGLGAVIVMNTDIQNYLISLTPMGSNPLEHILGGEKDKNTVDKIHAPQNQVESSTEKVLSSREAADKQVKNENTNIEEPDNVGIESNGNSDEIVDKVNIDKPNIPDTLDENKNIQENQGDKKELEKEKDSKVHSEKETEQTEEMKDVNVDTTEDTTEKKKKKVKRKDYEKHEITNKADFKIRKKLDAAEALREEGDLEEALSKYNSLLRSLPESPRAIFGKAMVTDGMAERQHSNKLLEEAMDLMNSALRLPDTPKQLRIDIGYKLADRQSFRGWEGKAAGTWRYLMERYPEEITFQQKYGTSFLIMGKNDRAREIFRKILDSHPDDSYSLVHLGFILKVVDTDYRTAIPLLQKGIDLDTEGKTEGKFFYHLGDAYLRTNQSDMAAATYRHGAERGLFLSQYQRSLYNADTPLTGRPWWTPEQTTYKTQLQMLEKSWKTIREEGLTQLNPKTGSFLPEEENLRETGDWKQFTLFQRGRKNEENCKKVPKTCALLERIPDATGCKRGQIKYSVMHPGVHVWPHTGPTNCRIRAHLGLKIPPGPRIRVGNDTRTWIEGKFIIFDDSFEHEVWHDGSELRLVLIVDFWHPELTPHQKQTLSPI